MENQEKKTNKIIVILIAVATLLVLGTIVVPGVIALIATPMVLDTVDKAKVGAAGSSALSYISAAENAMAIEMIYSKIEPEGLYTITEDGIYNQTNTIEVNSKGDKPTKGVLCFTNGMVTEYSMEIAGYTVEEINGNEQTVTSGSNAKTTLNCK